MAKRGSTNICSSAIRCWVTGEWYSARKHPEETVSYQTDGGSIHAICSVCTKNNILLAPTKQIQSADGSCQMTTSTETSIRTLNEATELNANRDGSWRWPNTGDAITYILEISLPDKSKQICQRHSLHSKHWTATRKQIQLDNLHPCYSYRDEFKDRHYDVQQGEMTQT